MDPRRLLPALTVATALVVAVTLVALGWRSWSPGGDPASAAGHHSRPVSDEEEAARRGAAAVLAAWDARRARAWARGDTATLRGLYVSGSSAGEEDVALLRRYGRRGLRVTGLQTQVLDLEVVAARPRRLDVIVTDRVVGGEAVGAGRTVTLPRDRPSTRRVVLVRTAGAWAVEDVQDVVRPSGQPSAAASTSRTSRSSKS